MMRVERTDRVYLLIVLIVGLFFRFYKLGSNPLWIDEVLFYHFANDFRQEWVTGIIQQFIWLFTPEKDEFWIRFQFALSGTLTIIFAYFVVDNKKHALLISTYLALFPLLVFWSRMARPYIVAAMFCVLGWRWMLFYIPALLTTPFAIIGINLTKLLKNEERLKYTIFYLAFIVIALILFNIRTDNDKDFFNIDFIINAKRLWVIPFTVLPFYIQYIYERMKNGSA